MKITRGKIEEIFRWSSSIVKMDLDIHTSSEDFIFLHIILEQKLPETYMIDDYSNNNLVCLNNSVYGGVWRIVHISDHRNEISCRISTSLNETFRSNNNQFKWEVQNTYPLSSEREEDIEDFPRNMKVVSKAAVDLNRPATLFFASPIFLFTRVSVYSITSIDTLSQSFSVDMYSEFRVRHISSEKQQSYVEQFLSIYNIPKVISCLRQVTEDLREEWTSYSSSGLSSPSSSNSKNMTMMMFDYCFKIRWKMTLSQRMNLKLFPFDELILEMILTINKPYCIRLIPNQEFPSVFQVHSFQWNDVFDVINGEIMFSRVDHSLPSESSSGCIYPQLISSIYLHRKHGFYMSNVMIPIFLISSIATASFAINEDGTVMDTSSRLSLTLTLLLTAVAYKFVVASILPQLSYVTLLDSYLWYCFAYLLLVAIENALYPAVVFHTSCSNDCNGLEKYVMVGLFGAFLLGHVGWFIYVRRVLGIRKQENEEVMKNELEARRIAKERITRC